MSQDIRLAELLAVISLSTDLGRGFPQEKALRTCLVAQRIAEELGLGEPERSDVFYASLIHPVGCTAFTYEGAQMFGTNELKGIPAYSRVDTARPSEGLRALREEVRGEPVGRRVRGVFKGLTAGTKFLDYVVRADCEAGVRFTSRIGLGEPVARIVGQVHERWDGKGLPAGLAGEEIELGARIVVLANQAEIYHRTEGSAETHAMLQRRTRQLARPRGGRGIRAPCREIFAELETGSVWDTVLAEEPWPAVIISEQRVDDLAEALADAVDLKSPHFLGHSPGVARLAERAAVQLGLGEDESSAIAPSGAVPRPRAGRSLESRVGQAGLAERRRVGASPLARVPHRANPRPLATPRAVCGDRRHAPRAQ